MDKKCDILGYSQYAEKETGEARLRIYIGVPPINKDKYKGILPIAIFLDYDSELIDYIDDYLDNKELYNVYYETTENILTGKTRVSKLIFKEKND